MISLNSIIFNGMDATPIDVQVQLSAGLSKPEFNIIGLADRAVKESAERIRNVLAALNLSLPPKRLTVNLSPADVEKSGSHFDLPILCGILCAIGVFPEEKLSNSLILGEVGLNGAIVKTDGYHIYSANSVAELTEQILNYFVFTIKKRIPAGIRFILLFILRFILLFVLSKL